jgi:transposase
LPNPPLDLADLYKIGEELEAALAYEHEPWIRTRLLTLRALLGGHSPKEAAAMNGVGTASARRWVKRARAGGLAAVLADRPRKRPITRDVVAARAEIAVALQRNLPWKLRKRLQAIDAVLADQSLEAAAAIASVKVGMLYGWIREIRERGVAVALKEREKAHKIRPHALDADPVALRGHAAKEKNRHMRKRRLALAYLAEGLSPDDAAIRVGLSDCTVREYRRRFRQGGIDAVRSKPYKGGITKLKPQEIQAVGAVVRANPEIGPDDLRARIESEFGVRYTPAGLRNMLKKQLGIVHSARGSPRIPPEHSSQTNEQRAR